jgi:hypothetical protein
VFCLVLWPAGARAANPEPQGKLVYTDDFSDPARSGLDDNVNATDYSRGFHAPGVYHLRLLKGDDVRFSLFPNQTYGQFTMETDVWDNSDDFAGDVSQGLVVRATDRSHFYAVLLDSRKGQFAARKMDGDGNWKDLIAWKPSPLIKQEAEVNHLRVDASGDAFTVYLNDDMLASFNDSAYARGGIGFVASNVDAAKPHIHFDNVKVYTTEGTAQANANSLPGTGKPIDEHLLLAAVIALVMLAAGRRVRQYGLFKYR